MNAALATLPFNEVWLADFEFTSRPGDPPVPFCVVAHELKSGRRLRFFGAALRGLRNPPYGVSDDALFVAYYASAEIGCHLALQWPVPTHVLDLCVEFRCMTNGVDLMCDRSLLGALSAFGCPSITAVEKSAMRDLAIRGEPFTPDEERALTDYCETDVVGLADLLTAMAPGLDLSRALLRGRYMTAAARVEAHGVPVDVTTHEMLRERGDAIKAQLVARIDRDFGVFDGVTFRTERWERYLASEHIPWPRLSSGRLALDDRTFREMARIHPQVAPMHELRHALSHLRLSNIEIGCDRRNRTMLSAFGAKTSRNTPSSTKAIFGPAVWLRSLIKPDPGRALAYVDWEQQEFGIAAALSGDVAMMAAYQSGDPYLEFGKQAGRIPRDATRDSHGTERELFKACALAVQYGMEAASLGARLGVSAIEAQELLRLHRQTYRRFWAWSDAAIDHAMLLGGLHTVFGWRISCGANANVRSLRNFPMQANGAEMMRLACCLATERGVAVCAPVHDAFLVEASLKDIESVAGEMQRAMSEASACVLGGVALRTDVKFVRYPDRYSDRRGERMWSVVRELLDATPSTATPPTDPNGY